MAYSERLPVGGETIFGSRFEQNFGGKGANQAVQCARLGANVAMAGMVGNDDYGRQYFEALKKESVDIGSLLTCESCSSGIASIFVSKSGSNSIVIVPGANSSYSKKFVADIEDLIGRAKVVVCQNEIPLESTSKALELGKKNHVTTIFNPAPATSNVVELQSVLPFVDILCPNEVELSTLTGMPTASEADVEHAANHLMSVGGCKTIVVTLGERGALIAQQSDSGPLFQKVSAPVVSAVDTVGAGDSFIGTLASHLAKGKSILEAVHCAVFLASESVQRAGSQKSYSYDRDIPIEYRL